MRNVDEQPQSDRTQNDKQWWTVFLPAIGVTGALVTFVIVYFSYDYVLTRTTPCESIFRQTQLGLSTKISFLKSEGELKLGREPLIELTERAQMTALNLKTCCTVLDAGKLDPEQFLQCKSKARAYESKVADIVSVVRSTGVSEETPNDAMVTTAAPPTDVAAKLKPKVDAARVISTAFNKEVVAVRKAQALETLRILPPRHIEVSAQEQEPNNDGLNTNVIELGKWITASIGAGTDADVYAFTTPEKYRDWIRIELENRSTTLEPRIELFDANKVSLGVQVKTTYGANIVYHFVAKPGTRYLARISNHWGKSVGTYLVRVVAAKAFDAYEPNDDKLNARRVKADKAIEASIMDKRDIDVFRVKAGSDAEQIKVTLSNRSETLRPRLEIYAGNKAHLGAQSNVTAGGDLEYGLKVKPGSVYYVLARDHYLEAAGAYELTINFR